MFVKEKGTAIQRSPEMPHEQWGMLGQWLSDRMKLGQFTNHQEGCVTRKVSPKGPWREW